MPRLDSQALGRRHTKERSTMASGGAAMGSVFAVTEGGGTGPEGKFFSGADVYQGYFQTTMVKIMVGRGSHPRIFYAHEGILSKSSFFERALNGRFKESVTREVELPEDDPDIFSSVLEYLYSEEYSPRLVLRNESRKQAPASPVNRGGFGGPQSAGGLFGAGTASNTTSNTASVEVGPKVISGYQDAADQPAQRGAAALRHARIYCLADKLGLEGLQKLVLEKLRLCGPVKDIHFIKVAAYLVENSSDTRGVLSAFLSPFVQGIPKST